MRNPDQALTAGLVLLLCAAGPRAEARIKKPRPIKRPAAAATHAPDPTPVPPPDAVPAAPVEVPATPDSVAGSPAVTPSSVSATPVIDAGTPVAPAVPVVPVVPVVPAQSSGVSASAASGTESITPAPAPAATPVAATAPQSPLPAAGAAPLASELDLFQLDSKVNLMAIRVTVASKSEESILDVPANVTVYSAQDIKALGYYTLADLANITAGYSSYTIYGEKVFETRGQKAGSFNNNKHLLLIDGIPVSHARANSLRAEEELPLLFARQVEFLRGPASALYGVSAFFGVLNIRPREQEQNGLSVETNAIAGAATGGTHQATVRVMSSAVRKTEDGESRLNLGYFDRGSSLDFVGTSDDPNNLYRDRRRSIFLDLSHRVTSGLLQGIGAGAIVLYKDGGMGEGFLNGNYTQDRNNLSWLTAVPYLRYTREFAHGLRVNSYLKYNYHGRVIHLRSSIFW